MSFYWNKYTGTLALAGVTGYMARLGGWPLAKWLAKGGWRFAAWAGPPIGRWSIGAGIAGLSDAGILARAFTTTRTAAWFVKGPAPIAAGLVAGAVAGTAIIYVAEEAEIVKEGSTEDVIDFYTGQAEGDYWGNYDWKGKYQGPDPSMPEGIDESGPGIIPTQDPPGYFNIPGNVRKIASFYFQAPYFRIFHS